MLPNNNDHPKVNTNNKTKISPYYFGGVIMFLVIILAGVGYFYLIKKPISLFNFLYSIRLVNVIDSSKIGIYYPYQVSFQKSTPKFIIKYDYPDGPVYSQVGLISTPIDYRAITFDPETDESSSFDIPVKIGGKSFRLKFNNSYARVYWDLDSIAKINNIQVSEYISMAGVPSASRPLQPGMDEDVYKMYEVKNGYKYVQESDAINIVWKEYPDLIELPASINTQNLVAINPNEIYLKKDSL